MKYLFSLISFFVGYQASAAVISCEVVERYNDQRIESTFEVAIEKGAGMKQVISQRDANIRFVAYFNQSMDVMGARINDDGLGIQSGNFVEPSHERAAVKVRYIKSKPEMQLFALDCIQK